MKAACIVRRIDCLGRVIISKELRRTMHIRVGDPLIDGIGAKRGIQQRGAGAGETRRMGYIGTQTETAVCFVEDISPVCPLRIGYTGVFHF